MSLAGRLDNRAGFHAHPLRWVIAAALTVLVHGAAVWLVLTWRSVEAVAPNEPPPAVMIDLSPLVVSPRELQQDVAVGPQATEAQPAPSDETAKKAALAAAPNPRPKTPDEPAVEPAPPLPSVDPKPEVLPAPGETKPAAEDSRSSSDADAASPSVPERSAPTDEELPLPPSPSPEAEAVPPAPVELQALQPPNRGWSRRSAELDKVGDAHVGIASNAEHLPAAPARAGHAEEKKPPATPPPKATASVLDKQRTKAESKRVERTIATKPDARPEANRTSAPAASNAPAANRASPASSSGATSSAELATWKGELVAHINRFKRFPPNAVSAGTASVAFAINRAGSVVSARLMASSGDPALDEEAVALLHRASPVPPPPAQFGGGVVTLTVPVRFDR
jgi:periplasmic protein TonB